MSNLTGIISNGSGLSGSVASSQDLSGVIIDEIIPTYDADAQAIIDAMPTTPDNDRMALINTWVLGGKAHGWWDKRIWWHMYASHAEDSSLLNWFDPGTHDGVATNAPIFTIDRGWDNIGLLTAYIDPNYNPITESVDAGNIGFVAGCATEIITGLKAIIGSSQSTNSLTYIFPKYLGGVFTRLFESTAASAGTIASGSSIGHLGMFRNGNTVDSYYNTTQTQEVKVDSRVVDENIYVLARNVNNAPSSSLRGRSPYAGAFEYLTQTEYNYLIGDTETFLDAIGSGLI